MSAYRTAAATKALPARCAIRFDELPAESQEHLRDVNAREHLPSKRERHTRLYAILVATTGAFVLVGATLWSQAAKGLGEKLLFDRRTPWDADEITMVTGACFLVGVFLVGGIASLLRRRIAPLGTFWYAHKAYLFDCTYGRVVAYPLALLDDQDVVGETAQISFGEIDLQIAFDLPAEAVEFLVPVRKHAAAAAACLARGARDEIPGANFIPDALLYRANPRFPWDRARAIPIVAGLALALVGRLVLPSLHASAAEARLVSACYQDADVCTQYQIIYPGGAHLDEMDDAFFAASKNKRGSRSYESAFPHGRHVQEAETAAASQRSGALIHYRKGELAAKEHGDSRMVEAMLTTLEVLNDAQSSVLQVRIVGTVDPEIAASTRGYESQKAKADAVGAPLIFGLDDIARARAMTGLREAIEEAVTQGAIAVREATPLESAKDAPATLDVVYRIFKGPRSYQSEAKGKGPYPEIDIDWTLTFRWPQKPELGEVSLTIRTTPPSKLFTLSGSSDFVYLGMMVDDAKKLGPEVRSALGLTPPAAAAPD